MVLIVIARVAIASIHRHHVTEKLEYVLSVRQGGKEKNVMLVSFMCS